MSSIELVGLGDLGRPERGDDLADAVAVVGLVRASDVVVVSRLVVAAIEGCIVEGDLNTLIAGQTRRVLRRSPDGTVVAETRHGFVLTNAGVVASGPPGWFALLPDDPGRSARRLRDALAGRHGLEVGVVVAEPALQPWRTGTTHVALGSAAGAPGAGTIARADEVAAAAGLLLHADEHAAVVVRGVPQGDGGGSSVIETLLVDPVDQLFR